MKTKIVFYLIFIFSLFSCSDTITIEIKEIEKIWYSYEDKQEISNHIDLKNNEQKKFFVCCSKEFKKENYFLQIDLYENNKLIFSDHTMINFIQESNNVLMKEIGIPMNNNSTSFFKLIVKIIEKSNEKEILHFSSQKSFTVTRK